MGDDLQKENIRLLKGAYALLNKANSERESFNALVSKNEKKLPDWIVRHQKVNELETLNLDQAAQYLNMHRETVRRLTISGDLPGAKPGKAWVFIRGDLAKWIRRQYYDCGQASPDIGETLCLLSDAGKKASIGRDLQRRTDAEYSKVLKLPTSDKPRSTKTS